MNSDIKFWNHIAEGYAKQPIANVPAYEQKLALTKARLRPNDVILDIGCGTGSLAIELARSVAQVHALDISSEMLRIAKQRAARSDARNVQFHHTTLTDATDFEPASFDAICAYNILHLVGDRVSTLQKIAALLKPGGVFVSSTGCLGDSPVPYGVILPVMRWVGRAPRVHVLRWRMFEKEIAEAGFTNVVRPDVGAKKTTAFVVATKGR